MVFFNIVTLEGVCGAHAIVVLTDPVKPNKPLCLPRVVKKNKILFDTGLRRLEGTFASFLSEKAKMAASNRPSTSRVKEGIGEI